MAKVHTWDLTECVPEESRKAFDWAYQAIARAIRKEVAGRGDLTGADAFGVYQAGLAWTAAFGFVLEAEAGKPLPPDGEMSSSDAVSLANWRRVMRLRGVREVLREILGEE